MGSNFRTGEVELDNKIDQWFSWNKDKQLEEGTNSILQSCSTAELKKLFLKRLEFGTAGLRGKMGPGFSQMNDLVVIQTAQGLLRYLKSIGVLNKGLMLGYDGRYNSKRFAELTAAIFVREGIKVYLPQKVCPTPFVSFGVKKYCTAAGVMVTASHNPKEDNGYKVYWSNGSQIISPHDKLISKYIEEDLQPLDEYWDTSVLESNPLIVDPLEELEESYYGVIKRSLYSPQQNKSLTHKITYTAMHGVGYPFIVKAFATASFQDLIPVVEQIEPDPEFPTVEFPNPEEGKNSFQLSFKTAEAAGSPIILANDPDADRLAVAEKLNGQQWRVFNGNEIGALLAWWVIFTYKEKHPNRDNYRNIYFLSSTVSSKIVKTIATKEGFSFEETLTGFKWMGNRTEELTKKENKEVLFAFEEAIGFMCGSEVPDKDGISAAVKVAELVAYLFPKGESLSAKLEGIYQEYGYHVSDNAYFMCYEPAACEAMFKHLRTVNNKPDSYPESLCDGKYKIIGVRDLTTGYDSNQPDKKARLPTCKFTQMITFTFDNGFVATLRTSGTEPKIKYYTELCASPHIKNLDKLRATLSEMVNALIEELIQPNKYGFKARKL